MKNTYELTQEFIATATKKQMFDCIYQTANFDMGSTIISFIKDCSATFCQDIAKRAYESYINGQSIRLSEKQAWCLTFEVEKIKHMYEAWVESEISKIN